VSVSLTQAVVVFTQVLRFLILARVIMSFFIRDGNNPIFRALYALTEPLLRPIRKLLERSPMGGRGGMMLDLSPLVALILISLFEMVLLRAITGV
jgi:YggT family protein